MLLHLCAMQSAISARLLLDSVRAICACASSAENIDCETKHKLRLLSLLVNLTRGNGANLGNISFSFSDILQVFEGVALEHAAMQLQETEEVRNGTDIAQDHSLPHS